MWLWGRGLIGRGWSVLSSQWIDMRLPCLLRPSCREVGGRGKRVTRWGLFLRRGVFPFLLQKSAYCIYRSFAFFDLHDGVLGNREA